MGMRFCGLACIVFLSTALSAQSAAGLQGADPVATAAPSPALPTFSREQIQEMIRLSAEKDMENDKRQRDYTYVERVVEHKLNGKGEVGSTETRTYDVLDIYNEQVRRLTSKDDKPLSAKETEKEDGKIQKIIDKRKNESESDRAKRLKREEKERGDSTGFPAHVYQTRDAHVFETLIKPQRAAALCNGPDQSGKKHGGMIP